MVPCRGSFIFEKRLMADTRHVEAGNYGRPSLQAGEDDYAKKRAEAERLIAEFREAGHPTSVTESALNNRIDTVLAILRGLKGN